MSFHKYMIENCLYPMMERIKGNKVRCYLRELQETQNGNQALKTQSEKLSRLLLHCKQHVPAYKDMAATDEEIRANPFEVLRNIAPLPKQTFQRDSEQHLADNFPVESRVANSTGGSTGQPIRFYMTREQVEQYEAARWRGLGWYGITPGSRSVMLWGNPMELSAQKRFVYRMRERVLKNRYILSAYDLTPQKLQDYVRFIRQYKPEYFYGYANALTAFAKLLKKESISLDISLKAVVSTSETLEDWQKELLHNVFCCPVVNEYGARDAGILAYSCPQGKMHISAENCVIEVLDPITHEPLPVGKSGILALTDLTNYIQPRIRYLLGDVGTLSDDTCSCGRGLPLLAQIAGREDDLLIGHNGTLVHGHVVGQLLLPLKGLNGFQLRQHSPQSATLYLVKDNPNTQLNENEIRSQFEKVLPDAKVTIEYVPSIQPTASGKIRYVVRECALPDLIN